MVASVGNDRYDFRGKSLVIEVGDGDFGQWYAMRLIP